IGEHTSELQSLTNLVCRLLLEKKIESPKERPLAQVMGVGRPAGHQHQIRVDLTVMSRDKDVQLIVAHSPALEWLTARPPHHSSSLLVPAFLSFRESAYLVACRPREPMT